MNRIRNFSIVAHINHGKSTLADRFVELCKKSKLKKTEEQYLDKMELERERGITIKAQCLTLKYKYNNDIYILNLIDTPGHSDFSYEVNRSLCACEGVVLLIDVTKGIQAQTISNYNKALEKKLKIIVALNKIDLDLKKKNILDDVRRIFKSDDILYLSAKTGCGIEKLIERIIKDIPAPPLDSINEFNSLIIDAWFDIYIGVTCLIKVKSGKVAKNNKVVLSFNKKSYKISNVGIFTPEKHPKDFLSCGEIGFVSFVAKNLEDIKVGTYICSENFVCNLSNNEGLSLPKVYANIYATDANDFNLLKKAILKLSLNDSALSFILQKSQALGFGFRCGFLGILHLEITKERLEREYNLNTIVTPPNIMFKVLTYDLRCIYLSNPADLDTISNIKELQEQIALTDIVAPIKYLGKVMTLCVESRGIQKELIYVNENIYIKYKIPLNELIFNFLSRLQTLTNGFASFNYSVIGYEKSDLNKLTILVNSKKIDALEFIIHKTKIRELSVKLVNKIKKVIPRQLFDIKIQASVGKKIIAKSVIKALKKNVLSKCYGGDITRKKKLIEKQKLGKKKLKKIGNIEIPHDAFIKIVNLDK